MAGCGEEKTLTTPSLLVIVFVHHMVLGTRPGLARVEGKTRAIQLRERLRVIWHQDRCGRAVGERGLLEETRSERQIRDERFELDQSCALQRGPQPLDLTRVIRDAHSRAVARARGFTSIPKVRGSSTGRFDANATILLPHDRRVLQFSDLKFRLS